MLDSHGTFQIYRSSCGTMVNLLLSTNLSDNKTFFICNSLEDEEEFEEYAGKKEAAEQIHTRHGKPNDMFMGTF